MTLALAVGSAAWGTLWTRRPAFDLRGACYPSGGDAAKPPQIGPMLLQLLVRIQFKFETAQPYSWTGLTQTNEPLRKPGRFSQVIRPRFNSSALRA